MQKIIDTIDEGIKLGKEAARLNSELSNLLSAAIELVSVANQRGDDEILHPPDDPKLWSARMQSAWDIMRASIEHYAPGAIAEEQESMQRWESDTFIPERR